MNPHVVEPQPGANAADSSPGRDVPPLPEMGTFGMVMLLVSLGMLFAASVVGYLVFRSAHRPWPPPGFPTLPRSLWLSTVVILFSSVTIQRALAGARGGDLPKMKRGLLLTLILGLAFLGLQTLAWLQIVRQIDLTSEMLGPYLKLFYFLTGLHAAHVVGGLIPLAVVTRRALAGRYNVQYHPGVRYSAMYWHFLDAVWCILFTVVYLT